MYANLNPTDEFMLFSFSSRGCREYVPTHAQIAAVHSYQHTCTQTHGNELIQAHTSEFTYLITQGYMTDMWLHVHFFTSQHAHSHML